MSSSTAQLNILMTNNSGQGYMTLNSLTNGIDSPPISSGNPPILLPALADQSQSSGSAASLLDVSGGSYQYYTGAVMQTVYVVTKGEVVYNLPNGTTLKIEWNIDPNDSSNNYVNFILQDGTYALAGANSPSSVSGNSYTYTTTLTTNN